MRVYCDKTARIMRFSMKNAKCLDFLRNKSDYALMTKFKGHPLDQGARTGVGWLASDFAVLYLGKGVRLTLGLVTLCDFQFKSCT